MVLDDEWLVHQKSSLGLKSFFFFFLSLLLLLNIAKKEKACFVKTIKTKKIWASLNIEKTVLANQRVPGVWRGQHNSSAPP